jgi:hypothetical protein
MERRAKHSNSVLDRGMRIEDSLPLMSFTSSCLTGSLTGTHQMMHRAISAVCRVDGTEETSPASSSISTICNSLE